MSKRGPSPTLKLMLIGEPVPLVRDDLAKLHGNNRQTSSIQKLRASHHRIARLAAKGFKNTEIAAMTGYTAVRVAQLRATPSMEDLEATYRERDAERESEAIDSYSEYLIHNAITAQRHIADQFAELDEKDELMPVRTALAVSADAADRIGYGKRSTQTNINFDADKLEKMIARYNKHVADSVPVQPAPARTLPAPSSRSNLTRLVGELEQPLIRRRA